MRRAVIGCTLLAAIALGAGCSTYGVAGRPAGEVTTGGAMANVPLENTDWTLVELDGRPARPAGDSRAPNLRLDSGLTRAAGNTGCNSFSGGYELDGASLRFGVLASTRRACVDPELNQQETAFMRALADTHTWRVAGDTLVLSGQTGQLARFEAQKPR